MPQNLTQKLIASHLVTGRRVPGEEIALKIDQTLTQDATGTLVMLELEAMGLKRVRTELSAQYVDHNLLQVDHKNADDHLYLRSACRKFGIWYSRPGNGVSHPVHMERFGVPGKSLLGSDSHTCAAGSLGMLAIGAGGLEVALAMAGAPFHVLMPEVMGVKLVGALPEWVSAKDVILEMLRRHGVKGGLGRIIEYYGPGVATLSAMDRHVIANMGAELGATTSVFPSDDETRRFLERQQRPDTWTELLPDPDADYDERDEIDLSALEPLIGLPSSPDHVVPVREAAGLPIYQAYIGSSANPGLRDFAVPALMLEGRQAAPGISLDITPTSRQILENLMELGLLGKLIRAGARLHQAGCGGCIGMGAAPATGRISLRTVPRNFPGRSGTKDDQVYLCSPETAAASALTGVITDPRTLGFSYPRFREPETLRLETALLEPPAPENEAVVLEKGPNIKPLPTLPRLSGDLKGPVLIKVGDKISTDDILPAGTEVLPLRSNIPEIAKFVFSRLDDSFYVRAMTVRQQGSFIVGGENYGQGSSREHAALAPRYLGIQAVIAKSFARIHFQNLCNFGLLPLVFVDPADWEGIDQEDVLQIFDVCRAIKQGRRVTVINHTKNESFATEHTLTPRESEMVLAGGLINLVRARPRA